MPSEPFRVVALLNASAGTIAGQDDAQLSAALAGAFEKFGISAVIELLVSGELRAAAERAMQNVTAQKFDAVVVGGGDGSIRTVASVLAGSEVPLGIVPLGTLNHFAKDLGIPLAIDEAVGVVAAHTVRSVDLGVVNGQTFINNSSIGFYPDMVLDRERLRRRKGLPKWLAMVVATLRVLRNFPLRRLTIHAQDGIETSRSPCVFIGNNEYHLTGISFGNRARLDGGELCVYVAKQQSRLALVLLAFRMLLGLLDEARDLKIMRLAAAEISSRRGRLLVALDGELELMRPPLSYRIWPGALRVFAPPAPRS
jgi:diacylglycerol kinase family enzyme